MTQDQAAADENEIVLSGSTAMTSTAAAEVTGDGLPERSHVQRAPRKPDPERAFANSGKKACSARRRRSTKVGS